MKCRVYTLYKGSLYIVTACPNLMFISLAFKCIYIASLDSLGPVSSSLAAHPSRIKLDDQFGRKTLKVKYWNYIENIYKVGRWQNFSADCVILDFAEGNIENENISVLKTYSAVRIFYTAHTLIIFFTSWEVAQCHVVFLDIGDRVIATFLLLWKLVWW